MSIYEKGKLICLLEIDEVIIWRYREMKELRDVAVKVIDLKEVLYPKDKGRCEHITLSNFFIKTDKGCIMKCDNCGKYLSYICNKCAVGQILRVKETNRLITVLPCDAIEMIKSGEYE